MRLAFRSPNWLGDAVMATVVPTALRRAHPRAEIHVLAPDHVADVFVGHPGVDRVVPLPTGGEVDAYRAGGYDRVLLAPTSFGSAWRAFRGCPGRVLGFASSGRRLLLAGARPGGSYRRDRHQVENYRELASLAGTPDGGDEPVVIPADAWRDEARALWPGREGPRIVLQPGATYGPAKRWSAARYAALARELAAGGATVAVVGGAGDAEAVRAVCAGAPVLDRSGRTTVGVLAAFLEAADVVVTNDTGPMHLAAAVGVRTVALFGSTSPVWTAPRGAGHRVVQHPVPCAPCFRRDCRIGYLCLEGIEVARVRDEVRAVLAAAHPPRGAS